MGLTITRRYWFQAAHRLVSLNEHFHGHHYGVEVTFRDAPVELADQCWRERVEAALHGQDLSTVVDPPTGEKLAQWIHERLLRSPLGARILGVAVQETAKNRYISSMTEARLV